MWQSDSAALERLDTPEALGANIRTRGSAAMSDSEYSQAGRMHPAGNRSSQRRVRAQAQPQPITRCHIPADVPR
ncbi:MAG: hypothetical protein JNM76_06440 [Betaproteobacteria bacterium]|nr:hypothetical protein [Betaproteobacteria bacterium]